MNFKKMLVLAVMVAASMAWADIDWSADRITISTAEELHEFRDTVNAGRDFVGQVIVLANDIELEGDEDNQWKPIGGFHREDIYYRIDYMFQGTFDGGSNFIRGIYIGGSLRLGLFGVVGEQGMIRNLGIEVIIRGGSSSNTVGGLVGLNQGIIENANVFGDIASASFVGGLVGANEGIITNSHSSANIFMTSTVGGFGGTIGGLVGANGGIIEKSSAVGNVSAINGAASIGGLVGANSPPGSIRNSFASGNVSEGGVIGGLVGMSSGSIENSYSLGNVIGSGTPIFAGALVGSNGGSISNSYALRGAANGFVANGSSGSDSGLRTAEQMKQRATFVGWNFDTIWGIDEGISFPFFPDYLIDVIWSDTTDFEWHGAPQVPTAISSNSEFPIIVKGQRTEVGNHVATAELITPNNRVAIRNASANFSIIRRFHAVQWEDVGPFVFNRMPQAPQAVVEIDRGNGDIFRPDLIVVNQHRDVGIYSGQRAAMVFIEDDEVANNIILTNRSINYEIIRRPLDVVIEETAEVRLSSNPNVTERDTIIVNPDLFDNRGILENLILSLVDFDNFATDENGVSDDRSVLRGNPRVSIDTTPLPQTNPSPAPRSSLDLLRYRIYLLTIDAGGMTADNYRIADTTTFVIRTTDYVPSFIRNRQTNDSRFGIVLENAVVSDFAKISVVTPEPATVNLAILDNLGNVVFTADNVGATALGRHGGNGCPQQTPIVWDLTNQSGRYVANGTYLIIVETQTYVRGAERNQCLASPNGRRFTYSTRIGVNR